MIARWRGFMQMIWIHLPNHFTKIPHRYEGSNCDEVTVAMKNCDPNGHLSMYISKIVSTFNWGRCYAFSDKLFVINKDNVKYLKDGKISRKTNTIIKHKYFPSHPGNLYLLFIVYPFHQEKGTLNWAYFYILW